MGKEKRVYYRETTLFTRKLPLVEASMKFYFIRLRKGVIFEL